MNTLLSNVDRITSKFSSLNQMLEVIAERVLPNSTAKAYFCSGYCGTYCYNGRIIWRQYYTECLGSQCITNCGGAQFQCSTGTSTRC